MFWSHPQRTPDPTKEERRQRALMELVRRSARKGTPCAVVLKRKAGARAGLEEERE